MSAKHKRPQRIRRNSMMESLGFSEGPSVWHSTPTPAPGARPATSSAVTSTTTIAPQTIEEMWNTTEFEPPSMIDWKPIEVQSRLDRGVRWPLVAIWLMIIGVLGAGGYYLWNTRVEGQAAAVDDVRFAGDSLARTLGPLQDATSLLLAGTGPVDESILTTSGDADDASRALFTAAADLPSTQSNTRTIAGDAAAHALEASGDLTSAAAYVGALSPVLTAPALITDPDLIDLATAATDYGAWRAKFERVLTTLPAGVMSEVTSELNRVSNRLESIQTAYLDGLREDDAGAALAAVRDLEGELATIWSVLEEGVDSWKVSIIEQIESARSALVSLTG